ADRAGRIIQRLRQTIGRRPSVRAAIDVNEAVREVARLLDADARRLGAAIELALDPQLPGVVADLRPIEQVLLQLLRNALEAVENVPGDRRRLTVSTRRSSEGYVEVSICDEGEGFGPADAEKLFEPFYTTKAEGIGLGLPVARTIIQAHGGR